MTPATSFKPSKDFSTLCWLPFPRTFQTSFPVPRLVSVAVGAVALWAWAWECLLKKSYTLKHLIAIMIRSFVSPNTMFTKQYSINALQELMRKFQ